MRSDNTDIAGGREEASSTASETQPGTAGPAEQVSSTQTTQGGTSEKTTTTTTPRPTRTIGRTGRFRMGRATSTVAAAAGCGVIIAAVIAGGYVSNRSTQQSSAIPFKPSALKVRPMRHVSAKSAMKAGAVAGVSSGMAHAKSTPTVAKAPTPDKAEHAKPAHETASKTTTTTVAVAKPTETPKSEKSGKSASTQAKPTSAVASKSPSKSGKDAGTATKTVALAAKSEAQSTPTAMEPTARPARGAGQVYLVLGSYPTQAEATAAQAKLTHEGVKCSVEHALAGWSGKRHAWYSLVSVDGFDKTHKSAEYDRAIKTLHALKLDPRPYRWRDASGASTSEALAVIEKGA